MPWYFLHGGGAPSQGRAPWPLWKKPEEGPLFLCTQKDANEEKPQATGLYRVGTAMKIVNILRPLTPRSRPCEGLACGQVVL